MNNFIPLFLVRVLHNRIFYRSTKISTRTGQHYSLVLQRYEVDDGSKFKCLTDKPKELLPEEKLLDNF